MRGRIEGALYLSLVAFTLVLSAFALAKWGFKETPAPSLADRINAACPPGMHVSDWTTGDEYRPVPAGTVLVTCEDARFHTRIVAVDR